MVAGAAYLRAKLETKVERVRVLEGEAEVDEALVPEGVEDPPLSEDVLGLAFLDDVALVHNFKRVRFPGSFELRL